MDRESPYLYAGSKYRVSGVPYRKSREVATTPLRRTCYKKYLRRTRVNAATSSTMPNILAKNIEVTSESNDNSDPVLTV